MGRRKGSGLINPRLTVNCNRREDRQRRAGGKYGGCDGRGGRVGQTCADNAHAHFALKEASYIRCASSGEMHEKMLALGFRAINPMRLWLFTLHIAQFKRLGRRRCEAINNQANGR